MRMWASGSRMWNKEINSSDSGSGAALGYTEFKSWAESWDCFPGYSGESGEASELPRAPEIERTRIWWEKLLGL